MKLIAFVLINCAYEVTSLKLPLPTVSENENKEINLDDSSILQRSNTDHSLNTRDIGTDYGSYMPTDYGNLNFVSSWVDSISRMLPTYAPSQPYYSTPAYYPYSTDYSQEQWSSQPWTYDWSQNQNYYRNRSSYTNTVDPSQYPIYNTDPYQTQPAVTKKISTVFNAGDSQEIKHKVIISPEFPDGTGYVSIGAGGTKDGKVYYRF